MNNYHMGQLVELAWPIRGVRDYLTNQLVGAENFQDFEGPALNDPFYVSVDGFIDLNGNMVLQNTNEDVVAILYSPSATEGEQATDLWVIPMESLEQLTYPDLQAQM